MVLYKVGELKEGMVVAKTIFRVDGSVVISKGTAIKAGFIERLKKLGITELYIREEVSDAQAIEEIVKEDTKQIACIAVSELMKNIALSEEYGAERVKGIVLNIIDEIFNKVPIASGFVDIRGTDDYTIAHSVNVAIIAIVTGISMGYSEAKLYDLGIGAILHDIGKSRIEASILNKPSKLNAEEFAIIKNHTIKGYDILKRIKGLSVDACNIALYHHERVDGGGYPYAVRGDSIPEMAKIVSVADVFDALTSDRVYREKMENYMVVDYLMSMRNIQFDANIVEIFCKNIALYPLGKRVQLSDGRAGFVVYNHQQDLERPKLMITHGKTKMKLYSPYMLDLIEETEELYIADTL